jgi:hypothetical protein
MARQSAGVTGIAVPCHAATIQRPTAGCVSGRDAMTIGTTAAVSGLRRINLP